MKTGPRSRLAMLLVALIAAGVGIAIDSAGWFRGTELASVDARFSIRGDQGPDPDIVIVALDDESLAAAGKFPIDRRSQARVIRELTKAGAAVIVEDFQFTEASDNPESDESLFAAVKDAPRIVLPTTEVFDDGSTEIFGGGDVLVESGAVPAWSGLPNDSDGHVRRVQLQRSGLDSVALATARLKLGAGATLPIDGSRWIDYRGPDRTYERLSFGDVEKGSFDASAVRGKVVVVGATAAKLQDYHATAMGQRMAGPEIQANAISTAIAGFGLHAVPGWIDLLAILVLAVTPPLVARRFGVIYAFIAGLFATAIFVLVAQLAFNQGTILTVVAPLGAAVTSLVFTPLVAAPSRIPLANLMERIGPPGANRRTRRVLASSLLGSALGIISIALVLQAANGLQRMDLSTVNQRFDIRGSEGAPKDIVLVAIDDLTFTRPPKPQWPFPRDDHADVIRNLTKAGAGVIAYDVQFTEAGPDIKQDENLAAAVEEANGRIVLATTEPRPDGSTEIFGGGEGLEETKAVPAWSGFPNDSDGRIRHLRSNRSGLESFDTVSASLYTGRKIKAPETLNWIDFQGPPATVKLLSFVNVKNGTFNAADVKDKIVVVGSTASNLQDYHATSTSGEQLMAGPEIHVAGIRTALEDFPLQDAPSWVNILAVVVLGLLAPLAGLRLKVIPALIIGGVGVVVFLITSQVLFQQLGWINHVAYAVLAGLAAMLATGIIHALTTAFEREQARDAFARFVPEAVVDQVLADADGVRLGGVRGVATVMFSDLRGFTSFSESLEPERVIESLNRYLTLMSEAILDHGGTLVAYMGDGIMAVFGAPLKQEDHADRALEAAREMLSRMDEFNGFLRADGLGDGFKMGIGLNSGPVMSGNVGSERRLEYTALGDTTNTAARLEGMTKGTPHQLFIADTTKQMLTRPVDDLVQVGEADVRGRKAKVLLWSISDEEPTPSVKPSPERVEA